MRTIIAFFLATPLLFSSTILLIHGMDGSGNSFLKMASSLAKDFNETHFVKLGYAHTLLPEAKCTSYDASNGDQTDLCQNRPDYYGSTNTLRTFYGIDADDFAFSHLSYRMLLANDDYETSEKSTEAISAQFGIFNNTLNQELNQSFASISVYTLNLSNNTNLTFQAQGKQIADTLKILKAVRGNEPVMLIGHSMGGLALRAYLQSFPSAYIQTPLAITIGSPHLGAGSSLGASLYDEAPLNLAAGSSAIRALNTESTSLFTPSQTHFIPFIISGYDRNFFSGDIVLGSDDDGVVSAASQLPPQWLSPKPLYFTPQCLNQTPCIQTPEAIYHTNEPKDVQIIDAIRNLVSYTHHRLNGHNTDGPLWTQELLKININPTELTITHKEDSIHAAFKTDGSSFTFPNHLILTSSDTQDLTLLGDPNAHASYDGTQKRWSLALECHGSAFVIHTPHLKTFNGCTDTSMVTFGEDTWSISTSDHALHLSSSQRPIELNLTKQSLQSLEVAPDKTLKMRLKLPSRMSF